MRLLTANLLRHRSDPDAYRALIEEFAPDVVVAQELGFACSEVLAELFEFHHLSPSEEFTGKGAASNFEATFEDVPMPSRDGTSIRLEVDGVTWSLLGVHLANPIAFPQWKQVTWRGEQVDAIKRWVAQRQSGPVAVAGDFNATPSWPVYRSMASGLDDLVLDLAERTGRRPDLSWAWRPGWPRLLRIDHVFGRNATATSARVVKVPGSDHHAVVVDLDATLG